MFADLSSEQAFDLSQLDESQVNYYRGVPMIANVNVGNAFLAFRSPYDVQHPNRPYLHLMGYLNSVDGNMPYNITTLKPRRAQYSDVIYEFSNAELANLVDKGLYERDFKVPDKLTHATLRIPVTCDFALVKPDKKQNMLLVYGKIKNADTLDISSKNTDYVFANDFEKAESLLPHKAVQNTFTKNNEDELSANSIDFDEPTNSIDFGDMSEDALEAPVFDTGDSNSIDFGDDVENTPEKAPETNDAPGVKPEASVVKEPVTPEDKEADKIMKRAQRHMKKRREELAKQNSVNENTEDKNDSKSKNKKQSDTQKNLDEQISLQAGRQSKIANEVADDAARGIVESSVPDTPNDFDAINDEDYGKHQSRKERNQAIKEATKNGEINDPANKKALAHDHESPMDKLSMPDVPVDDEPDDALDL